MHCLCALLRVVTSAECKGGTLFRKKTADKECQKSATPKTRMPTLGESRTNEVVR